MATNNNQSNKGSKLPGKIWTWQYKDPGYRYYVVYKSLSKLYVQTFVVGTDQIKLKHRVETYITALTGVFSGEDEEVEKLLKQHKFHATRIPLNQLKDVELLPLFGEKQVRLRFFDGKKKRKFTLKFKTSEMDPDQFFGDLRTAVSPGSVVQTREMDLAAAVRGPVISAIAFAAFGIAFIWDAIEQGSKSAFVLHRWIQGITRAIGPIPLIIFTVLGVGLSIKFLLKRIRKRPTTTFWQPADTNDT
ncbi:MAG: hypothetical protein GTO45_24665 [Candidatus Aminicenantes bacterium]|nr:hypothetical protein [Candidatus Aminicenantes bacterium]NIM81949.1 hypothetical protein [Candidatus Aminicenantes bacterium]NIN21325.1 hypothetical protein [Candidatus Aminicenantes bacterium]NIN45146.1 hypothetical protein [Candidatus Aminicenantes bacterium]NIN87963.1 hypothetical protein [Candidatus Aminicenantes bacterium]